MSKARRAIGLLDLLVSLAIIVILAAITYPLASRAILESKKGVTRSNLRQLHLAVELYRIDHNGLDVGTPRQMALPSWTYFDLEISGRLNLVPPVKGPDPGLREYRKTWPLAFDADTEQGTANWVAWSRACRTDIVILADFNFNDKIDVWNPFWPVYGEGIRLNGQLVRRRSTGNVLGPGWWSCPAQDQRRTP